MTAVLKAFGGVDTKADAYDEILVTHAHKARLMGRVITNAGLPPLGDAAITGSDGVPEGLGLLRRKGKVVGVIDFRFQQVILFGKATK